MVQTSQQVYDGNDLPPEYGERDFGVMKVIVNATGVIAHTTPKLVRSSDGARLLVNQMAAALDYMTEQEALYNAAIAAKKRAERDGAA